MIIIHLPTLQRDDLPIHHQHIFPMSFISFDEFLVGSVVEIDADVFHGLVGNKVGSIISIYPFAASVGLSTRIAHGLGDDILKDSKHR